MADDLDAACSDAAASMTATPTRTTFDPELIKINVFARIGCDRIERMLAALADMFPENVSLQMFLEYLRSNVLNDGAQEEDLIRQWYDQMTGGPVDLIEATKARDAETLLNADVEFLKRIGAREMYDDPDVLDEDREQMMRHVELINEAALTYINMPGEFQDLLTSTLGSIDTSQPLELQTIFSAVANTVRSSLGSEDGGFESVDASERLLGLASKMMNMVSVVGVEPIMRMCNPQQLCAATGCADVNELTEQLKDEARKCFEMTDMPTDAVDAAFNLPFLKVKK